MWWHVALGIGIGLALAWTLLLLVLWRAAPKETSLQSTLRLLPDVLRLLRRLAGDRALPRGVRVRLWLAVAYLALPIDLVPDFIPVLGYADDAIVVLLVLRSTARRAGVPALERHWSGSADGLTVLLRVAGMS